MRPVLAPLLLALAACQPLIGPQRSSDYDLAFARAYSRGTERAAWERPPRSLSVEQLYALHQYGRRAFHPWRSAAVPLACRGAEAVPFLKTRIRPATLGSLLEVFRWMRWLDSYDLDGDADLQLRVRTAYADLPGALQRGYADDFVVVTRGTAPAQSRLEAPAPPEQLRRRHCG